MSTTDPTPTPPAGTPVPLSALTREPIPPEQQDETVKQTMEAHRIGLACQKCGSASQVWITDGKWLCHRLGCQGNGGLEQPAGTPMTDAKIQMCASGDIGTAYAEMRDLARDLERQLASAREECEQINRELMRTGHSGAKGAKRLVDSHLQTLQQLNERDKPAGFDSWEEYHDHIVKIRNENASLRAQLADAQREIATARHHLGDHTAQLVAEVDETSRLRQRLATATAELQQDEKDKANIRAKHSLVTIERDTLRQQLATATAELAEQKESHGKTIGIVSDALRERDKALAELKAAREDGERLDWLAHIDHSLTNDGGCGDGPVTYFAKGFFGNVNDRQPYEGIGDTARAAIDAARQRDAKGGRET